MEAWRAGVRVLVGAMNSEKWMIGRRAGGGTGREDVTITVGLKEKEMA